MTLTLVRWSWEILIQGSLYIYIITLHIMVILFRRCQFVWLWMCRYTHWTTRLSAALHPRWNWFIMMMQSAFTKRSLSPNSFIITTQSVILVSNHSGIIYNNNNKVRGGNRLSLLLKKAALSGPLILYIGSSCYWIHTEELSYLIITTYTHTHHVKIR